MSVHDKCSDIYFKYFSFMVVKKWHTFVISNLTKDLRAGCVMLPEHDLRGDANGLLVRGRPFTFAQGWEGNWREEGRAAPTVVPIQSNEILVEHGRGPAARGESLRWSLIWFGYLLLIGRACQWQDNGIFLTECSGALPGVQGCLVMSVGIGSYLLREWVAAVI